MNVCVYVLLEICAFSRSFHVNLFYVEVLNALKFHFILVLNCGSKYHKSHDSAAWYNTHMCVHVIALNATIDCCWFSSFIISNGRCVHMLFFLSKLIHRMDNSSQILGLSISSQNHIRIFIENDSFAMELKHKLHLKSFWPNTITPLMRSVIYREQIEHPGDCKITLHHIWRNYIVMFIECWAIVWRKVVQRSLSL